MIPDKIYIGVGTLSSIQPAEEYPFPGWQEKPYSQVRSFAYISKDALLEWANAELERLWELVPDSDKVENETATPMEMRHLGQYMQMESVIDKLNSI